MDWHYYEKREIQKEDVLPAVCLSVIERHHKKKEICGSISKSITPNAFLTLTELVGIRFSMTNLNIISPVMTRPCIAIYGRIHVRQ